MIPLADFTASRQQNEDSELGALALLAAVGAPIADTFVLLPNVSSGVADDLWLLRSLDSSEPPFASLHTTELLADPRLVREACLSFGESALGMRRSALESALPTEATAAELELAFADLVQRRGVAPQFGAAGARFDLLVARARERSPNATLVLQRVAHPAHYGQLVSRDLRSGRPGCRAQLAESPRMLLEPLGQDRELSDCADLAHVAAQLSSWASHLEAALRAPVRLTFALTEAGPQVLAARPERRSAKATLSLANELVLAGVISQRDALQMLEPSGLGPCFRLGDADPKVCSGRGVAAGGGLASGLAAFTPAQALQLAGVGLTPVLIVLEVEPEDAPSVRSSAAVISVQGGITGPAAVMCRALSKPCVAGAGALRLHQGWASDRQGRSLHFGERVTVDGASGRFTAGPAEIQMDPVPRALSEALAWADAVRPRRLVAAVLSAGDIESAALAGADAFAVVAGEVLLLSALGEDNPAAALERDVGALFAAAEKARKPLWIRTPRPLAHLLWPRSQSEDVAVAMCQHFEEALRRARSGQGLPERSIVEQSARGSSQLLFCPAKSTAAGQPLLLWDDGSDPLQTALRVAQDETALWLTNLTRLPKRRILLAQAALRSP